MNTSIYKLKDIFTIENVIAFFKKHILWFLKYFSLEHIWHICHNIKRFMKCKDFKENHAVFKCPVCNSIAIRPHTCKSKLCSSCGKVYSDNIAENFYHRMINKKHKSILFSIPDYLWNLFIGNIQMLADISDQLYQTFQKYFYDKAEINNFGFSVFFHTFGRDLKFYPHIHIVITQGGFKKIYLGNH